MALVEHAPCKINLGLHVLRKRPDGHHDIETVLHRVDWTDRITVEPADSLSMTCSDPSLPTDQRNLCLQAAVRLADVFDVAKGAALHLEKRIPYGAGLGGGSSNAATTIRLLARLWDLSPSRSQLHTVARDVGADVSFFLRDTPAALATGRGDALKPLSTNGDPYRVPFPVLIAVPDVQISTPWAYDQVTPHDANRPSLAGLVRSNDLGRWQSALVNDFEPSIVEAYPAVAETRETLLTEGAAYVSLSGSGAGVYGLFRDEATARAALSAVQSGQKACHLMLP